MLCSAFSMRLMISRSTVSGEAPGYGMFTTMSGISTSGIWFTRRFLNASSPRHMRTMTIATVVTGFLMLKLERNIACFPRFGGRYAREAIVVARLLRGLLREHGRFRFAAVVDALAVLKSGGRIPQHRVTLREPVAQRIVAGARVLRADAQRYLLQRVILHAPRECLIAL